MPRAFIFLTIPLLSILNQQGRAQSVADLAVELVLDTEKLTSLKATLQQMYEGYTVLEKGYTGIRDIAMGSFNLHQNFLDALLAVSPAVQNDSRVPGILTAEHTILSAYVSAAPNWTATGVFTPQEIDLIITMYSTLLERCQQSIEELTIILTADQLRMSDDQRMNVIGRIEAETRDQVAVLQGLNTMLAAQVVQRQKVASDINTLKSMYGLPN